MTRLKEKINVSKLKKDARNYANKSFEEVWQPEMATEYFMEGIKYCLNMLRDFKQGE